MRRDPVVGAADRSGHPRSYRHCGPDDSGRGRKRLIGGLANLPLFKTAGVSLPERLALSVLADKEGVSNKILARGLGVTGQAPTSSARRSARPS